MAALPAETRVGAMKMVVTGAEPGVVTVSRYVWPGTHAVPGPMVSAVTGPVLHLTNALPLRQTRSTAAAVPDGSWRRETMPVSTEPRGLGKVTVAGAVREPGGARTSPLTGVEVGAVLPVGDGVAG